MATSRNNIKRLISWKTINIKIPIKGKNLFLIKGYGSSH